VKPLLLCLHGWGGSSESFTELRAALAGSDMEILTPDLPGFGKEVEPKKAWTNDDYAEWVSAWIKERFTTEQLRERQFSILGHSHGGRIAMKLALSGQFPIHHLYLCASAGIRHPRHFKRILGLTLAKSGKALLKVPGLRQLQPLGKKFLYTLVRVHDYEKASPIMRETMIKVTAEDFRPYLEKILVPTDIFWGQNDGMTPVKDAHILHKGISGSKVHIFPGVRHRVHRECADKIAQVLMRHVIHS
jgi:pimeloyl-ACP methyl ester carboxylesterase